jgi:hypothetical protein
MVKTRHFLGHVVTGANEEWKGIPWPMHALIHSKCQGALDLGCEKDVEGHDTDVGISVFS